MDTETLQFTTNLLEGATRRKNILENVHICGLTSKNGYRYSPDALKNAIPLYENVDVYVNHNNSKPRPVEEKIGLAKNISFKESTGLWGDLVLNEKHPAYEQLVWFADNMPSKVGCSHDVDGKINKSAQLVESIKVVHSVDIVSAPATTAGLTEGVIGDKIATTDSKNRLDRVVQTATSLLYDILWPTALTDEERQSKMIAVLKDAIAEIKSLSTTNKKEEVMDWTKVTLEDVTKNAPHILEAVNAAHAVALTEAVKVATLKEKQVQDAIAKLPEKARTAIFEAQIRAAATPADVQNLVEALILVSAPVKVESTTTSGTQTTTITEGKASGLKLEDIDAALGLTSKEDN